MQDFDESSSEFMSLLSEVKQVDAIKWLYKLQKAFNAT